MPDIPFNEQAGQHFFFISVKAKFGPLCPDVHIFIHIFTFGQNMQNKLT